MNNTLINSATKNMNFFGAVKTDLLEKVQEFVENGMNIDIQNDHGYTAIMFAVWHGHKKIVEYLHKAGADLNIQNNFGYTAIMYAVWWRGYKEIVEYLHKAGAELNIQNNDGNTAIMLAVWCGYKEIVEYLRKAGADLNIQNNFGETAIMIAAQDGRSEIVEYLKTAKKRPVLPLKNLCVSAVYKYQIRHDHLPAVLFELQ